MDQMLSTAVFHDKKEPKEEITKEKEKPSRILPISLAVATLLFMITGIVLLAFYAKYDPLNVNSADFGPSQDQINQRPALLISGIVLMVAFFIAAGVFTKLYCKES